MDSAKNRLQGPRHCSVNEDGSQIFLYKTPGFFSEIKRNSYPEMYPFCVTDHWHDEVEFIYCKSGSLIYTVEGTPVRMQAGQGVFINSRKLHVGSSDGDNPCVFYVVILHPMLLCASKHVDTQYIEPIIRNNSLKYLFLDEKVDWQKKILDDIEGMYYASEEECSELKIQMLFFSVWVNIFKQGKTAEVPHAKSNHHLNTLKDMISYIQQHYQEKISLEDISRAGCVGKTMCTKLFSTYVNRTPFEFLRDYRIEQSMDMLKSSDLSITDISYETGFSSPSYFGECFRDATGCTPLEYRRENSIPVAL